MNPTTLALQFAFYLLFAFTLVAFIRRPSPLTLDIFLMFAALAGLFAIQLLALVVPEAPEAPRLVGVALLLAQPGLALRLARHVRRLPGWVPAGMVAGYLATLAAVFGLGIDQPLTLVLAVGYFLVGDGAAAAVLGREAARRGGFARWRLASAGVAMALLALTILVAAGGGEVGSAVARAVAVAATVAFLLAFIPPRWLRRLGQQAVAYRFLANLAAVGPGAGAAGLWQRLADAAASLTGAVGAEVRVAHENGMAPAASSGTIGAPTSPMTLIAIGKEPRRAELRLWTSGAALFAEDDLALLELLGAQAVLAAEREEVLAERTALAERLATTNAALAQASAAKSDFLAAMSHELRTPLNAILGFSELVLSPPGGQRPRYDEVREYTGHIHNAGQHLLELINDVLDLARVEADRLELRYERTDIVRLVAETLDTVRPLAEVKGHVLVRMLPDELDAEVDPARLRQIAYNLLSNAIKFTPPEGTVTVELTADDAELRLTVADTGRGIAGADQGRIFAPFEQLTPQAGEGTGLGLALTRRLVEAHGGRIELDSTPGEGSRFTIMLPRRRAPAAGAPPVEAGPGAGPLVLIVEDDAAAAELVRLQLGQAGYRTALAEDGESGLAAAHALAPAAILLDILLPGLDGWEVLKRLRADPITAAIPVMVVTIVDDASLGLALGAVDYFVKPVARDTLLDALDRLTLTTKVRQRTVSVLAIDDDPSALALYRSALSPEGFRVLEAASGEDGLATARGEPVDLIVLDLLLPDLDGFEVAARLKADPATAAIPILVVTGHALTDEDKARLNDHVVGVLAKGDEALDGLRAWLARIGRRYA